MDPKHVRIEKTRRQSHSESETRLAPAAQCCARNTAQRRDIVETNHEETFAWSRIYKGYWATQVVFEVKNFNRDLGPDEFRQLLSYLCGDYGKLGFIVTRSSDMNLKKGAELNWVREMHYNHQRLIRIDLRLMRFHAGHDK